MDAVCGMASLAGIRAEGNSLFHFAKDSLAEEAHSRPAMKFIHWAPAQRHKAAGTFFEEYHESSNRRFVRS
jgi:hypothetical protein